MKIGILALQGGVAEHVYMLNRLKDDGYNLEIKEVRLPSELDVDAIILPGGESTTQRRLMERVGLVEPLKDRILEGLPVLAVCAGVALVAKRVKDRQSGKEYEPVLNVLGVEVIRNYFGRQRESFEADVDVKGIGKFRGVFIRAPIMRPIEKNVEVLAEFEGPVMVKQGNIIATSFHPELTNDVRIHKMLVGMVKGLA